MWLKLVITGHVAPKAFNLCDQFCSAGLPDSSLSIFFSATTEGIEVGKVFVLTDKH